MTVSSELVVSEIYEGLRLDAFVARAWNVSRTVAQEAIDAGSVLVNEKSEKKRHLVARGDRVAFFLPKSAPPSKLTPVDMSFDVLFEDSSLFVINKPPFLVVHPAPGNYEGTFVHGFLARFGAGDFEDPIRPGIIHRLDKETSGVLMAAKTRVALQRVSSQFHDRSVHKEYVVIVHGVVTKPHVVEGGIGRDPRNRQQMAVVPNGRPSCTEFVPIASNSQFTLVKALPKTGRTHQIRVHAASIGHPVLGDSVYGKNFNNKKIPRQMLHCSCIRCAHPVSFDTLTLQAQLPVDMLTVMREIDLF